MPLEVLDRPLVLLCLLPRGERPQVFPSSRLRILMARIDAELARLQFANHIDPPVLFALDAPGPIPVSPRVVLRSTAETECKRSSSAGTLGTARPTAPPADDPQ